MTSTVATPAAAGARVRTSGTDRAVAENRLGRKLVAPAVIVMLIVTPGKQQRRRTTMYAASSESEPTRVFSSPQRSLPIQRDPNWMERPCSGHTTALTRPVNGRRLARASDHH